MYRLEYRYRRSHPHYTSDPHWEVLLPSGTIIECSEKVQEVHVSDTEIWVYRMVYLGKD